MSDASMKSSMHLIGIMCIVYGFQFSSCTSDTYLPVYYTNTCEQSGKALSCDEGHVIKINDVRCFPHNIKCSEREKIARLCDGLRSCAKLDMRRQMNYYCKSYPTKNVEMSFRCLPETERPVCRTNLCGNQADTIRCKPGRVFHLLSAKCYHGQRECLPVVYKAIYRTCESQSACRISDVINQLPSDSCFDKIIQQSNIFMDYICVDDSVQTDNCTDRYITLTSKFGILKSPGYPHNPLGNSDGCRWVIYPEIGEGVDLIIHVAYSKDGREVCNSKFLQVQYTDCDTGMLKTDIFCDEGRINVKIHSCGTVYVMHWPYSAGEKTGNRFLLSYYVTRQNSKSPAYVPYTFPCERIDPNAAAARYTIPKQVALQTTEDSQTTTHHPLLVNDDPVKDGANDSKGFVQNASIKDKNITQRSDPWKMVTLLRVVVVNIFLGLLIIALLMALIFVCYRYKTVGRRRGNKQNTTPLSNTATTLDDKGSTEMHPLQPDNKSPESDKYDTVKPHSFINIHNAETGEIHEEATLTITPNYETTIFHFNRQPDENEETLVCDTSSGISSFLPQSLNRTMKSNPKGQTTGISNQNKVLNENCTAQDSGNSQTDVPNKDTNLTLRDTLHHYKIDNKEYAIILKSPQRSRNVPGKVPNSVLESSPDCQVLDQPSSSKDMYSKGLTSQNSIHNPVKVSNVSIENNMGGKSQKLSRPHEDLSRVSHGNNSKGCNSSQQYRPHIHTVPDDDFVTRTTMHVIPEHDCLLHKIPPPPPPVNRNYWGPP